jgi:hypothetical protein
MGRLALKAVQMEAPIMVDEGQRRKLVKELADAVSTQAHVANSVWIALMTVALLAVLPPVPAKDGNASLPFNLGQVDQISFQMVVFCILLVLSIAFASAHSQQVRAQTLAHAVVDSLAKDLPADGQLYLREWFDMCRKPSLNRVAPLAQSLKGKYQFSQASRNCPTWRRLVSVVYYVFLKLASLVVYFGLPSWALWQAHGRVSVSGWQRGPLGLGGILAGVALLQVLLSDVMYSRKVLKHLWGGPDRPYSNEGTTHLSRAVYAVDIGSTRCEAGQTPNFAWARVDPSDPSSVLGSSDIEKLADQIIRDLQAGQSVALGFEAPLFIPVPVESSALCHGRENERSRSFAAPAGLAVATLGLHQAAWILRRIADSCGDSIQFEIGAGSWPPSKSHPVLFCWEAFVSDKAHGATHVQDAATAAMAFLSAESNLAGATTITAERPLSLIAAAALWSGLATDSAVLHQPTVVIRPDEPFAGIVKAA